MNDDRDRLSAALRDIAREDRLRASPRIRGPLLAEFRAIHVKPRRARIARAIGAGTAATVAVAVGASLWIARRPAMTGRGSADRLAPIAEVTTTFMPLAYSAVPYTDAHLVRMEVPRAALSSFGLAPLDVRTDDPPGAASAIKKDTVLADVLVGEDGLARAVRFVRAPRAPGVAP